MYLCSVSYSYFQERFMCVEGRRKGGEETCQNCHINIVAYGSVDDSLGVSLGQVQPRFRLDSLGLLLPPTKFESVEHRQLGSGDQTRVKKR